MRDARRDWGVAGTTLRKQVNEKATCSSRSHLQQQGRSGRSKDERGLDVVPTRGRRAGEKPPPAVRYRHVSDARRSGPQPDLVGDANEVWNFQQLGHQWIAIKTGRLLTIPTYNLQFKVDLADKSGMSAFGGPRGDARAAGTYVTCGRWHGRAPTARSESGAGQNTRYAMGRLAFGNPHRRRLEVDKILRQGAVSALRHVSLSTPGRSYSSL